MNRRLQNVLIAALLVIVQMFLLNNLQLRGVLDSLITPCVYILFVILMPIGTSQVLLLLTSFALGLSVDIVCGTMGINAAASTLIGFVRPWIIQRLFYREDCDKYIRPSMHLMGKTRFILYVFILTFIFHFALCFLEVFTFNKIYYTLLRVFLSAMASTLILLGYKIFFQKKGKR